MLVKTVTCKLRTNNTSSAALADTMRRFNLACNAISKNAWATKTFRTYDLHHACYHAIRAEFGLPAQLTVRAIAKVADSYKTDRSIPHQFGPRGAVVYDARCFAMKGVSSASLTTTKGRFTFSLAHGGKQRDQLAAGATGEADLLFRDGNYYLAISVKLPDPPHADTSGGMLGVDLGIVQIATDSEGTIHSSEPVKVLRRKMRRLRAGLQHQAKKHHSKSAYRHLCRIRHKHRRFQAWVNHNVSKQIVESAILSCKALALENLKGIRERGNGFGREFRWQLGGWAFDQLRQFVSYKAQAAGLPVVFVDPRNTSRTCSACGHCDKANRKSQSHFECQSCGLVMNADCNAALNIARHGANVTRPMDGAPT
jgi:IS605 OrfB family transposase